MPDKIYIDRRTGGLGDLMMLSAGLDRLLSDGHQVTVRLDPKWHCLFEAWESSLKVVDKEPNEKFDEYIDLIHPCPASLVESRWAMSNKTPAGNTFVPETRTAIFWRSMNLPPEECTEIPIVKIAKEHTSKAEEFLSGLAIYNKPIVYIQTDGNESYRTWSKFDALMKSVLKDCSIVFCGSSSVVSNCAKSLSGCDILTSCAVMSKCDVVISCDSMAIHASAALGIPSVGIFGPIGFNARGEKYPYCSSVIMDFPCIPCWRNQNEKCLKSNTQSSDCMDQLLPESVENEVLKRILEVSNGQKVPSQKIAYVQQKGIFDV